MTNFSLVPIPLFVFMGEMMFHSGIAHRAIDAIDRLIYRIPGRLSIVAVIGGTIFAALSGTSLETCRARSAYCGHSRSDLPRAGSARSWLRR